MCSAELNRILTICILSSVVEGWCCVEMIASVMVLYFVDFPLMIPSERACVSSHSTVTSAVIPARHPDGKFKASPEHKIGLERDVVAKVLRLEANIFIHY